MRYIPSVDIEFVEHFIAFDKSSSKLHVLSISTILCMTKQYWRFQIMINIHYVTLQCGIHAHIFQVGKILENSFKEFNLFVFWNRYLETVKLFCLSMYSFVGVFLFHYKHNLSDYKHVSVRLFY